jgi:cytochrome c-type biogenesis protein CcmE
LRERVLVTYRGTVPDNFAEGREVVVEGRPDETGTFSADLLLTRCESKYKAKLERPR